MFINKPGPTVHYSHFATIYLSSCLAFQCLQALRSSSCRSKRRCSVFFRHLYWALLSLCGLIAGIAYSRTPKPECAAVEIIAFLHATGALLFLFLAKEAEFDHQSVNCTHEIDSRNSLTANVSPFVERVGRWKSPALPTWVSKPSRIVNRFLMVLHVLLSILAVSGAIQLALLYRFANP